MNKQLSKTQIRVRGPFQVLLSPCKMVSEEIFLKRGILKMN